MIGDYFKRIMVQLKTSWLFYQADFMSSFESYLRIGSGNNSLMMGLNSGENATDHQLRVHRERLQTVIKEIVSQYVNLMKVNPMLMLESLFRFSDAYAVSQMLNNYFIEGDAKFELQKDNKLAPHAEELLEDVEFNFDV